MKNKLSLPIKGIAPLILLTLAACQPVDDTSATPTNGVQNTNTQSDTTVLTDTTTQSTTDTQSNTETQSETVTQSETDTQSETMTQSETDTQTEVVEILPLESGVLATYSFENNADDSSDNARHATINGEATYVNGQKGFALSLSQSDQYASLPSLSVEDFSVALTLKFDSVLTTANTPVYSFGMGDNAFAIMIDSQGNIWLELTANNNSANTQNQSLNIADNQFHQIIAVADQVDETLKLYVDGELAASVALGFTFNYSNVNQYLGYNNTLAANGVSAQIDELIIYDRALNNINDILWLYFANAGLNLLNDSGITSCSNLTTGYLDCPVDGFVGQDAEFGRDYDANLNKKGAGNSAFDFTKLDANGSELDASAATWSCVLDNHTGLVWEVKTTNGGLHDTNSTYSWYNTNNNNGEAGTSNGGNCSNSDCDTQNFTQSVNSQNLCGFNNWQLPTKAQLHSIADYSVFDPSIDTNYFPNTLNVIYWSSSATASSASNMWTVSFEQGRDNANNKNTNAAVRLVRSGQ